MKEIIEISLLGDPNTTLFGNHWKSTPNAKGVIVLVHGMGEHVGRYNHFAEFFAEKEIDFLGVDLTGFGKAKGKKGHGVSLDHMLDIVQSTINYTKKQYGNTPIFVFGQSMGGNIALNYQLRRDDPSVKGYIIASPWIQTATPLSPLLISAGKILSNIAPKLAKGNDLDVAGLSDQQEVIEAYKNDPLVHDRVSFGFGMEMYNAAEFLNEYKSNDLPKKTLLVHSKNDWLTSAKATEAFYGRNSKNAVLRLWDDKMHELHNSTEQKEILAYYHDWMQI